MFEKIKGKRLPIFAILSLVIVALVVLGAIRAYRASKLEAEPATEMRGTMISTSFGTLKLVYQDGTTTLVGELSRSTPCVDWQVGVMRLDTGISINISDENREEICVQSLGTPQVINEKIVGTDPESIYIVGLEGTILFQGALEPVTLPPPPAGGMAQ